LDKRLTLTPDDRLWEPAGPVRVVLGLIGMVGAVTLHAFSTGAIWKSLAMVFLFASALITIRPARK
jgi:hypothetical protein